MDSFRFDRIIDISHWNENVDFIKAKSDGINAVIHKATQGARSIDHTYKARKVAAQNARMLWGAYHFGTGGDGSDQADHFVELIEPTENTLLCLDFEYNPSGSSMTIDEAEEFVYHIFEKTNKWPVLYSSTRYLNEKMQNNVNSTLFNCDLWLARWSKFEPRVPAGWKEWKIWQHTDGESGLNPSPVNGIGRCDRNIFNGNDSDLDLYWKTWR